MNGAEELSLAGLLLALALPWACGFLWVRRLLLPTGRYHLALGLGLGYVSGIFATTVLLRLWDAVGIPLSFPALAALLAVLALVAVLPRRGGASLPGPPVQQPAARWERLVVALLLGLVLWRYLTMLEELLLRPLYAWDAWMNWTPKAIVWFHLGNLAEFVSPDRWMNQAAGDLYTLGNRRAWDYPITVPLIQLWSMLGAGTWDHGAVYLPWLLAPLCMGLGIYGHLRLAGVALVPATVASYLVLSMPYVNVHSVLAGYADIWLAAAFVFGVGALYEWQTTRDWRWGCVWLAMAALCAQLKVPGLFLGAILAAAGLRGWLNLRPAAEAALVLGGLGVLVLAMALELSADVPYLGRVALGLDELEVGRVGRFPLEIHPVGPAFAETFLVMVNWHLLGYLLPPFILLCLWRGALWRAPGADVLAVLAGVAFVCGVFFFTGHYKQALNFVTLNRALLYLVPAVVLCCFLRLPGRVHAPVSAPP